MSIKACLIEVIKLTNFTTIVRKLKKHALCKHVEKRFSTAL